MFSVAAARAVNAVFCIPFCSLGTQGTTGTQQRNKVLRVEHCGTGVERPGTDVSGCGIIEDCGLTIQVGARRVHGPTHFPRVWMALGRDLHHPKCSAFLVSLGPTAALCRTCFPFASMRIRLCAADAPQHTFVGGLRNCGRRVWLFAISSILVRDRDAVVEIGEFVAPGPQGRRNSSPGTDPGRAASAKVAGLGCSGALAWGARGPEFESRRPDQIPQRLTDSELPKLCVWSPFGVQKWTPARGTRGDACGTTRAFT
jgi:hypothetical protein